MCYDWLIFAKVRAQRDRQTDTAYPFYILIKFTLEREYMRVSSIQ